MMPNSLEKLEAKMARFIAKADVGIAPPNCRGTLLYLLGERTSEFFAWQEDIINLLQRKYVPISDTPQINDVAIWHDITNSCTVLHAGLVVQGGQPPLIRSRIGPGWEYPVKNLTPFDLQSDLDREYHGKSALRYYRLTDSKTNN